MIIDGLEIPKWAGQFLDLSESDRKEIVELRLKQLQKSNPEAYKATQSSDFTFVGVVPGICYMRTDGEEIEKPFWHKHSAPMLLYYYKTGRCFMIFGPELRLNTSLVNEIDNNEHIEMTGISG